MPRVDSLVGRNARSKQNRREKAADFVVRLAGGRHRGNEGQEYQEGQEHHQAGEAALESLLHERVPVVVDEES